MALYELILEAEMVGQQIINRWNYSLDGGTLTVDGAFALAFAFGAAVPDAASIDVDSLFHQILEIQTNAVGYRSVFVRNIYDPEDFYDAPAPVGTAGLVVGEVLPPFA